MLDAIGGLEQTCSFARLSSLVRVTASAALLIGTSAELTVGELITVEELLYAMMLPSGNDAAQSLALYFGVIFAFDGKIEPNEYLSQTFT